MTADVITTGVDAQKYGRLLARALPSVIETEEENERMLAEVERLIEKGARRTPEEDKLFDLMVHLIEQFEERHYQLRRAEPHEVLQELMRARDMKQRDLVEVFGSQGYASDIINGKRGISKAHARRLSEVFNVSPELFI